MTEPEHRLNRIMQPEGVAVLVLAALLVGLIVGQALGRRQGLEVRQVALPPEVAAGLLAAEAQEPASEDDAAMAATAPEAPQTVAAAREMVQRMADAPAAELAELGQRKFGNKVYPLAIALYEQALQREPARPEWWLPVGQGYLALGQPAEARQAFERVLQLQPTGALAEQAKVGLASAR